MPASELPAAASPRRELLAIAALAAAHAVLFAAAYPRLNLWPLTFVSVVPLARLALSAAPIRAVMVAVFVTQLVMWLWLQRWLTAVTVAGYPALCVYLSLFAVGFVWVLRLVHDDRRLARLPATLLVPVIWVGLECLRGELLFDGYPWFLAAHPAVQWPPLTQSADLLGTYVVSFLVVMVAGLVVDALRLRRGTLRLRTLLAAVAATIAVHGANLLYGAWRIAAAPDEPGPVVLAVQTNLPQDNKKVWTVDQQATDLASFIELTEQAAAAVDTSPDLVIWPETMFPGFGLEPETIRWLTEFGFNEAALFRDALTGLAERLGTPMLVGSPSYLGLEVDQGQLRWDRHFNSVYLVTGAPPYQRYDKFFLTPFGETMPYISAWPWLERKLLALGATGMSFNLDSSSDLTRLELPDDLTVATPICFEDTVGRVCRAMIYDAGRKRVDILVNVSNDGWFAAHDAGRWQHLQIARFRCIENRVPLVRSVNTGVTAAVDSSGRLISPLHVTGHGRNVRVRHSGWLAAELPLDSRSTVYGRLGDVWAWACLAAAIGLLASAIVYRRWGKR